MKTKVATINAKALRERARIRAILDSPEAKGRDALARQLAFTPKMSASVAVAALRASPKSDVYGWDAGIAHALPSAMPAAHGLGARMAADGGGPVTTSTSPAPGSDTIVDLRVIDGRDIIDRLPEAAAKKLRALRDASTRARDLMAAESSRVHEAESAWRREEGIHRDMMRHDNDAGPMVERDHPDPVKKALGWRIIEPDTKRIKASRDKVDGLEAEYRRRKAILDSLAAEVEAFAPVVRRSEIWLSLLPRGAEIAVHEAVPAKAAKAGTEIEAVERVRGEIEKKGRELAEVRGAPMAADEVKHAARAAVEKLATAGAPDLDALIREGGPIGWPTVRGLVTSVSAEGQIGGFGVASSVDVAALTAWLGRDRLIARLDAEIDARVDHARALSHADRVARVAKLSGEILLLERDEEALIEMAESRAVKILRRRGADPRAVLGLAGTLPGTNEQGEPLIA